MSVPPSERSTRVGDWPEALAWFDRWAAADNAGRLAVLAELQAERPALVPQVQAMIDADQGAEAQNALADGRWSRLVVPPPALHDEQHAGLRLGPWELQHAIGRGGMGQVWLATRRDGLFSGRAAVKLLNAASLGTQAQARFAREGELLARLSHPHIAKLLDAGFTPQGTRYLVLEYVQGERLDQWCDARRLGVPERLRLFMQVCDAVSFAHANLVVHRDLKPANILVCDDGQGSGQVKLLDFGIAKLLGDSDSGEALTELTRFGFAGMTPEYAAPEQVEDGAITTATDVYALGVVLFGLLTGTRPYGETSRGAAALARAIVEQPARALTAAVGDDPAAAQVRGASNPTALRQVLRGDLETIVAKALKKQPAERYATVRELHDDVQRHLNLEPVRARPDSWRYRATRFAQRNRLPVAAVGVAVMALLGGVGAATWQWRAATQEAERTRAVVQVLTGIFTQLTPEATGSAQVPVVELLRRGWRGAEKSLAGDPELKGEVARPLGMMLQSSGDMESAASALSVSREHLRTVGRRFTAPYLEVTQELGYVMSRLGRNAEARQLFQDVIDTARAVPGPLAAETVNAQVQLGVLARREGRLDEARTLLAAAAEAARRGFDEAHPSHVLALQELADVAREQGQWAETRRLLAAVAGATQSSRPDEAQSARLNSATLDVELGNFRSAAEQLRVITADMDKLFGPAATYTIYAGTWWSVALFHSGEFASSDRALDAAHAQAQRSTEPDVLHEVQLVMARQRLRLGDCERAEPMIVQGLAYFDAGDRTHRPFAERLRMLWGECQLRRGRAREALVTLDLALDRQRDFHGARHLDLWPTMLLRALAIDVQQGPAAARPAYEQALQMALAALPAEHPDRLRVPVFVRHAAWRESATAETRQALAVASSAYSRILAGRADAASWVSLAERLQGASARGAGAVPQLLALLTY